MILEWSVPQRRWSPLRWTPRTCSCQPLRTSRRPVADTVGWWRSTGRVGRTGTAAPSERRIHANTWSRFLSSNHFSSIQQLAEVSRTHSSRWWCFPRRVWVSECGASVRTTASGLCRTTWRERWIRCGDHLPFSRSPTPYVVQFSHGVQQRCALLVLCVILRKYAFLPTFTKYAV